MKQFPYPKILIACPTSSIKDYAFLDWLMNVRMIDYPKDKMEILMVDNSQDNHYEKYLKSWGIKTRRVKPRNRNPIEFMCDSHNEIVEYMLKKDFDYVLHLESDIMIRPQTLRELLHHSQYYNLPIVSASYFTGNDEETHNIMQSLESFGRYSKHTRQLEFKERINYSNKFFPVFACGIGCVLIRKDIFETHNVRFKYTSNNEGHPDTHLYHDLSRMGIWVYLDTSIYLEHKSKNWNHNLDYITLKINN